MMKKLLYKGILPFLLVVISFAKVNAQTGMGTFTPDATSALEIKSTTKGLLIPRLATTDINNISNPASGLMVYNKTINCIVVNKGTPAAPNWDCTLLKSRKFFYMPSINIPTNPTLVGQTLTKDLYGQYASEFGSPVKGSDGAPASIPYFPNATDLNYYVTYCDPALIQITGIDANGVMTYKLLKTANFDSYVNIVFMPK